MDSVERALALRRMGSLEAVVRDGEGCTISELVGNPNNQPDLDALDWELAASTIDAALDPQDERVDWLKRRLIDRDAYKGIASEQNKSREAVRLNVLALLNEKRTQLTHLREFLAA